MGFFDKIKVRGIIWLVASIAFIVLCLNTAGVSEDRLIDGEEIFKYLVFLSIAIGLYHTYTPHYLYGFSKAKLLPKHLRTEKLKYVYRPESVLVLFDTFRKRWGIDVNDKRGTPGNIHKELYNLLTEWEDNINYLLNSDTMEEVIFKYRDNFYQAYHAWDKFQTEWDHYKRIYYKLMVSSVSDGKLPKDNDLLAMQCMVAKTTIAMTNLSDLLSDSLKTIAMSGIRVVDGEYVGKGVHVVESKRLGN